MERSAEERIAGITKMIERYIELSKDWDDNEPELMVIAEALPYPDEIDQPALANWKKIVQIWEAGVQDDQLEYLRALEQPWTEVIQRYDLEF